jgi:hypothetical protein
MEKTELAQTQRVWLLLSSLHLVKVAIAQLEPQKLHGNQKMRLLNLRNSVVNYLNLQTSGAMKQDRENLNDLNFDVVALMTEVCGMISQLPENQIEWYLNECKKLVFTGINREISDFKKSQEENV